MPQTIVEQLISEAAKRRLSIPKLAKELCIPQERIYKWKQGEGNPKGADIDVIKAWINREEVTNNIEESITGDRFLKESVRNLTETNRIHAENEKISLRNIERLIALLEQANSAQLSKNHVAGPEGRVEGNGFADVRPPAASGSSRKPGKQEGRH
jgi:hypothetical protein